MSAKAMTMAWKQKNYIYKNKNNEMSIETLFTLVGDQMAEKYRRRADKACDNRNNFILVFGCIFLIFFYM